MNLSDRFRQEIFGGDGVLPVPAAGHTSERHRRLFDVARRDVALARLVEAHVDALAILAEAGRAPRPRVAYGVWAADAPADRLHVSPQQRPGIVGLTGTKAFCTGAGIVDRALVTVSAGSDVILVDVDVRPSAEVGFDNSDWVAAAFADTRTARAAFAGVNVAPDDVIGEPGWYLDRVGFWHGACGPAACWAGGAAGLADWMLDAVRDKPPEPHRDAHLGALQATRWRMTAALAGAGDEIDRSPLDQPAAHRLALALRADVERGCTEIVDHIGRAMGPRPAAFEPAISRRLAEVQLYIRQCHAERDLEALGRAVRSDGASLDHWTV